jgi:hypothetical protein
MYISLLPLTSALAGVGGQLHAPAVFPTGKTRYPLCRSLGGPEGPSKCFRKISPIQGIEPRTVLPVASRYTVYVIPAQSYIINPLTPNDLLRRRAVSPLKIKIPSKIIREKPP